MALPKEMDFNYKYEIPKGVEDLVTRIKTYYPSANVDIIYKAYNLAEKAHKGQYRKDGSPFFLHPPPAWPGSAGAYWAGDREARCQSQRRILASAF